MPTHRPLVSLCGLLAAACGDASPDAAVGRPSAGTPWSHPDGTFHLQLPDGWSVLRSDRQTTQIRAGTDADAAAMVLIRSGSLDADERGRSAADLLTRGEARLLAQFAQEGLAMRPAGRSAQPLRAGHLDGAEQTWDGDAGGRAIRLWIGSAVQGDGYVAITAVATVDAAGRVVAGARAMLLSLAEGPGQEAPNGAAGAVELTGEFGASSHFQGGSMTTVYRFDGSGRCGRRSMTSGGLGFGGSIDADRETPGTYRVSGAEVSLRFADGEEQATLLQEGGAVTGLRFGDRVYRRL